MFINKNTPSAVDSDSIEPLSVITLKIKIIVVAYLKFIIFFQVSKF